jgi:hypothetical protein
LRKGPKSYNSIGPPILEKEKKTEKKEKRKEKGEYYLN